MNIEGHIDAQSHDLCLRIRDGSVELIVADPRDETMNHRLVVPPERLEIRLKDAFHALAQLGRVTDALSEQIRQKVQP